MPFKKSKTPKPPAPKRRHRSKEFNVERDGSAPRLTYLLDWIPPDIHEAVHARLERDSASLRPILLTFLRDWAHR